MRRKIFPITLEEIRATHCARQKEIRCRLGEFRRIRESRSDTQLFEELVYCIFTAGVSARMGLKSVDAVRHLLADGGPEAMTQALIAARAHRYPGARPGYIVVTRDFLREDCALRLNDRLEGFTDPLERRDWLAKERRIKGIGYKEASHFLRNVGFKRYAILDKHILRTLAALDVIESPNPPTTRDRYLATEARMRRFADRIKIDFDELDLVLWSLNTGEVLK